MQSGLVPIDPALLALIHGAFLPDGTLQPFVREIMLVESHVAGTGYRDLTGVEEQLAPGNLLPLQREPDNTHDPLAIKIMDESGHHLGYVPKAKNEALARLLDAGKLLFGRIDTVQHQSHWLRIDVRIYLRDW